MKNASVLFFAMWVAVMTSGCVSWNNNNGNGRGYPGEPLVDRGGGNHFNIKGVHPGFFGIPRGGLDLVGGARGRSSLPDVAKRHEFIFQTPTTDIHHSEGGELQYDANLTPFGPRERLSIRNWNNTTIEKNPPDPWRYFYPPQ